MTKVVDRSDMNNNYTVKVKVYNRDKVPLPVYKTDGAAAMDIVASKDYTLRTNDIVKIDTGLFVEIPEGYKINIRSRSGMALSGLTLFNAVGLIDSDYRGEIQIILYYNGKGSGEFKIKKGDRIAQLEILPVYYIKWIEVESLEELSSTERGNGGFGSTGV